MNWNEKVVLVTGGTGSFVELDSMDLIQPPEVLWFGQDWEKLGQPLLNRFRYGINPNTSWLTQDPLHAIGMPFETGCAQGNFE